MNEPELTMAEALRDPMIRLMLRADRVPLGEFARLLKEAARARTQDVAADVIHQRPQRH